MRTPRETINTALLARLATLATFKTTSRLWVDFEESDIDQKLDALFLLESPEGDRVTKQGRNMPEKFDLGYDVVMQIRKPTAPAGPGMPPPFGATKLNPILDAMDALFRPLRMDMASQPGPHNLNGLVDEIWIEGTIQKNYAFLGGSVMLAVVPLHVRCTNTR